MVDRQARDIRIRYASEDIGFERVLDESESRTSDKLSEEKGNLND